MHSQLELTMFPFSVSTLLLMLTCFSTVYSTTNIIGLVRARILNLDESSSSLYICIYLRIMGLRVTSLPWLRARERETDHCPYGHEYNTVDEESGGFIYVHISPPQTRLTIYPLARQILLLPTFLTLIHWNFIRTINIWPSELMSSALFPVQT